MDPHRLTREYERRLQALAQPADDVKRHSLDKPAAPMSPRRGMAQLRDRHLAHRCFGRSDQIVDACCDAWNAFTVIPGAIPFTLLSFLGQS